MASLSDTEQALITRIQEARENDPEAAVRLSQDAIATLSQHRESAFSAELHLKLGICLSHLTRHAEAIQALAEAIRIYRAFGDVVGTARASASLGNVYRDLSLMTLANDVLSNVHNVLLQADAPFELACLKQNLGVVANEMGRLNDAIRLAEEASQVPDKGGIALSLFCANDLVVTRLRRANSPAHWEELDRERELAVVLDMAVESVAKATAAGQHRIRASLITSLGEVCMQMGRFDVAARHLNEARRWAIRLRNTYMHASVLRLQGTLARKRGNSKRALVLLKHAEAIAQSIHLKRELEHIYLAQSDTLAALGRYDEAWRALKRYRALREELRVRSVASADQVRERPAKGVPAPSIPAHPAIVHAEADAQRVRAHGSGK